MYRKNSLFVKTLFLCLLLLLLCLACVFAACEGPLQATVSFFVDDNLYYTSEIKGYSAISMPENPTKDGYTFAGWFWDKDTWQMPLTVNSFLDSPLSESFSVFAYFKPIADLFVFPSQQQKDNVFKTIKGALNAASPNQTIFVSAGLFAETLLIDKPVTILGNNYDVDANSNRKAETVLTIGTNIGDSIFTYLGDYSQNVVTITSSGVTIKGLTIDGNNPNIANIWTEQRQQALFGTGEIAANTSKYFSFEHLKQFFNKDVEIDAAVGIFVDSSVDKDVKIENNILKNFWQFGISTSNTTVDSTVCGNKIYNVLPMSTHYNGSYWGAYGIGISVGEKGNGQIFGNTILDCQLAIQVQSNNAPIELMVKENKLLNCNTGIWLNHTRKQFDFLLLHNEISFGSGKTYFNPATHFAIAATNLTKANSQQPLVMSSLLVSANTIKNYDFAIGFGSVDSEANAVVNGNEFFDIKSACISTSSTMFGYTMNKPVFLTIENNAFNGQQKYSFLNQETVVVGE